MFLDDMLNLLMTLFSREKQLLSVQYKTSPAGELYNKIRNRAAIA
jgi:hypothetical protein